MNKLPFSKEIELPVPGTINWAIEVAKRTGHIYAGTQFQLWVENSIGVAAGDLLRAYLVNIQHWMINNGQSIEKILLEDLVNYACIGINKLDFDKIKPECDSKKWMLDSKGAPVVVYHGTNIEFSQFEKSQEHEPGDYGSGFYFTGDRALAQGYAEKRASIAGTPIVMSFNVSIENPYIINIDSNKTESQQMFKPILDKAQAVKFTESLIKKGFDGVVVKLRDIDDVSGEIVDEYLEEVIAFNKSQIRVSPSATTNDTSNTPPMLTESALLLYVGKSYPRLLPAVSVILERGRNGEPGGGVIAQSAYQADIENLIAQKSSIREGFLFRNIVVNDEIIGIFESRTKTTLILGCGLTPDKGIAAVTLGLTNGPLMDSINSAAMHLIEQKDDQPEITRKFLERAELRMRETTGSNSRKDPLAYIVQQAVIDHVLDLPNHRVATNKATFSCE